MKYKFGYCDRNQKEIISKMFLIALYNNKAVKKLLKEDLEYFIGFL